MPGFCIQKSHLPFCQLGGGKYRHHSIIVTSWNRVELMVMTLGTLHGMSEKSLPDRIGDVIKPELPGLLKNAHSSLFPWPHTQKSSGHHIFRDFRIHFITCDLLLNKLIIGFILIERADHIISVAPGIGPGVVICKPPRISIARNIQPMTGKMLAIVGKVDQLLHKFPDHRFGFSIFPDKFRGSFRVGWKTSQTKRKPAIQFPGLSINPRFQSSIF